MPLLRPLQYVDAREAYGYKDPACRFSIVQTGNLTTEGSYRGIFAAHVRSPDGLNLRGFELVCQEVFEDCSMAAQDRVVTSSHLGNLRAVSAAIVHWKMASQGGRAAYRATEMLSQWDRHTPNRLISAFENRDLPGFCISGVGIPTATAFMRFLFPDDFGVMDSRVVGRHTKPAGITSLSTRRDDGYITNSGSNARKYYEEYVPFLRSEARWLNAEGVTFQDVNANGEPFTSAFRACDIEMALFQSGRRPDCAEG
jgi:hypothetical protein